MGRVFSLLLAAWAGLASLSGADALPPKPANYVTDSAGVMSPQTVAGLNARLAAFERETSNQVLVATFPSIPEGWVMEDFTQRTAEAWKAGQKGRDNGVVFFVFPNDRKMRIEVGYGLEGAIPDALAKRILTNEAAPAFRAGDFSGGIVRVANALMAASKGEYRGTGRTQGDAVDTSALPAQVVVFVLFIFVFILFLTVAASRGTTYGPNGRRDIFNSPGSWGGSSGGSWGGSSGGGFGGGGGGFSGGGGGFGGGGASGGW